MRALGAGFKEKWKKLLSSQLMRLSNLSLEDQGLCFTALLHLAFPLRSHVQPISPKILVKSSHRPLARLYSACAA